MRPSSGMRSAGWTTKTAPTGTSDGAISTSPPGDFTRTVGGERSISAAMAWRARPALQLSSVSDKANRKETEAASSQSPRPMAPMTATVISRFMSGRCRRIASHALGKTNHKPITTATASTAWAGTGNNIRLSRTKPMPVIAPLAPVRIA